MRVALANNKGGVGKSSLTARFAEELAARGRKVLAVDVDPQGNLSRMLGWPEHKLLERPTINEVVLQGSPGCAVEAILPCGWDQIDDVSDEVADIASRIDLLPGRFDFELRVGESAGHAPGSAMARHARQRLAVSLNGLGDEYDFTLLDLPPSIGLLSHMGLEASDGVLIPLYPDYDPVAGAVRMRDLVTAAQTDWGLSHLHVAGVLLNRYDASRKKTQRVDYLPHVVEVFGDALWEPWLTERAVLADVSSQGAALRSEPTWRSRDRKKDLGKLVDRLEKHAETIKLAA